MKPWPQIDPGEMVHQITIMQQQAGEDVSGAVVNWVPFVETWAAIEPVRGTDLLKAGQNTGELYLTVKIRWQHGINSGQRVRRIDGSQYQILYPPENPGERNVILILLCLALGREQAST